MVYLNQAATTYPKPQCVLDAHAAALMAPPSGQFRSAGSLHTCDVFEHCRKLLGELLDIHEKDRIFFSSGATDSLNRILGGLLPGHERKQVITTATEHNSVLRPLLNHKEWNISVDFTSCDELGKINLQELQDKLSNQTLAVIVNHCSNVTGMVQDIKRISQLVKAYREDIILIVDGSQSAGCIPVDVDEWNIDAFVFTGHKSLYGVQGTGGYYVRSMIPFLPVFYGGTGRNSSQLTYEEGDYEYEAGTQNGPGVAALSAGVQYVLDRTVEAIQLQERKLMKRLYQEMAEMKHVVLYGNDEENRGPVMSFQVTGLKASDVGYILQSGYDITVRTGLHCAPLIHKYLGTDAYGTVRISISDMTTEHDIEVFLKAMKDITESITQKE